MKYLEYIDTIQKAGVHIMKNTCDLKIHSPFASKTDIVNITPLKATCDTMRWDDDAEKEVIKWAIDFDKWQYSWHNEIKPENYNHFLEIIQGKVIEKSEQLIQLNAVATFLQNKIEQLNADNIATEKSNEQVQKEISDCEPF